MQKEAKQRFIYRLYTFTFFIKTHVPIPPTAHAVGFLGAGFVKREIANDDDSYAHIGFHLANDIRNQSPASEVLLTLCGWNIDTLLDKTPPIAIED